MGFTPHQSVSQTASPQGEAFTKAIFQTKKKSELFFIRQNYALPPSPKGKALSRKDFPFLPKKILLAKFSAGKGKAL